MLVRVVRWGDSLAIRLPDAGVASFALREGALLELAVGDDRSVLRAPHPHYTLDELVAAMRPEHAPAVLDNVLQPPLGDELL